MNERKNIIPIFQEESCPIPPDNSLHDEKVKSEVDSSPKEAAEPVSKCFLSFI